MFRRGVEYGATEMPSPKELLECVKKQDHDMHTLLCGFFVRPVVGCHTHDTYREELVHSAYVTVSDEALAHLVYENQEERWKHMAENKARTCDSLAGKYTDGGRTKTGSKRTKMNRGWSDEGVRRFNELCRIIKARRATAENGLMENEYLRANREHESSKHAKAKAKKDASFGQQPMVQVYMDDMDEPLPAETS